MWMATDLSLSLATQRNATQHNVNDEWRWCYAADYFDTCHLLLPRV